MNTTLAQVTTRALAPTLGVEVCGVDLSQPLADDDFGTVRDLWLAHKVVLLRGQTLTEEDMVRFGRRLGELQIHVRDDTGSKRFPEVLMVSNAKVEGKPIGVLGDTEAPWHIDQIYMARPTFGTMLYGVTIPPEGGNTFICDMKSAYERLPPVIRARIDGKHAISSAEYFNRTNGGGMTAEQLARVPPVSHPLVRTHPLLRVKSLFMSPGHTMRIEGVSDAESAELLALLTAHATQSDLIYEHRWRVGDVLMWDNTQTMHRRDPFDGAHVRLLKRISFMYPPDMRTPV